MAEGQPVDPNVFDVVDSGQTISQPSVNQPTTNNQQGKFITGHSLDEHIQAINNARSRGDSEAVATYTTDYNRELEYQKQIGAFDKVEEPKLTGTSANLANMNKGILASSQQAVDTYNPKYSGLLDSVLGFGRILLNTKGAKDEAKFRSDIASVRTSIRKYISGAAISKYEAAEFKDLIPKVTDSDEQIKGKLEKLQEKSMMNLEDILSTAGYKQSAEDFTGKKVKRFQTLEEIFQ